MCKTISFYHTRVSSLRPPDPRASRLTRARAVPDQEFSTWVRPRPARSSRVAAEVMKPCAASQLNSSAPLKSRITAQGICQVPDASSRASSRATPTCDRSSAAPGEPMDESKWALMTSACSVPRASDLCVCVCVFVCVCVCVCVCVLACVHVKNIPARDAAQNVGDVVIHGVDPAQKIRVERSAGSLHRHLDTHVCVRVFPDLVEHGKNVARRCLLRLGVAGDLDAYARQALDVQPRSVTVRQRKGRHRRVAAILSG